MIFKCKICGGSLDVKTGERTAVCEYCGVRQSIPSFIDIKAQEINNIANNYLAHNEFDKAENLYAQILIDNKSDADAYWNILMCRYGVTYVKDPASGKYIPTCNRTLYAPIFNDDNYKNAIKYADEKQKALFEENSKIIDDIQKGILSVSRKEKPFDIFISYKETDANGARTKDSIAAQDLYEKLTAEGYKVFFSRITLEDKIGTEYEPYIYAALASSKVMMTVSSSRENLESVWVKNEWSRFLSFMGKDSGKTLIPLYFDMDKTDLPDDFAHMPSYDMKLEGIEQDLIRGIKKLIPLPVMLLERRKKRNKILKRVGIAAAACAVIAVICAIPWFMKLLKYNTAMQLYYDKNYPEATWAFDDLGSYRSSEEMKKKCELSWRKSLAEISRGHVTWNKESGYYISANGNVETYDGYSGSANNGLEINEHGKIISICGGSNISRLYALHEDGYTDNIAENNNLKDHSEWKDLIQISDQFNSTNVVLRSDGTMLYGDTEQDLSGGYNDDWIKPISEWHNVTSFDVFSALSGEHKLYTEFAAIVAVNTDGDLYLTTGGENTYNIERPNYEEIAAKFRDIKSVSISITDYEITRKCILNIAGLTKHGTIMSYIDGDFVEEDAKNIISINFGNDGNLYILNNKGELKMHKSNFVILSDVVYMDNECVITRTGRMYMVFDGQIVEATNAKTKVHSEWIERMN